MSKQLHNYSSSWPKYLFCYLSYQGEISSLYPATPFSETWKQLFCIRPWPGGNRIILGRSTAFPNWNLNGLIGPSKSCWNLINLFGCFKFLICQLFIVGLRCSLSFGSFGSFSVSVNFCQSGSFNCFGRLVFSSFCIKSCLDFFSSFCFDFSYLSFWFRLFRNLFLRRFGFVRKFFLFSFALLCCCCFISSFLFVFCFFSISCDSGLLSLLGFLIGLSSIE